MKNYLLGTLITLFLISCNTDGSESTKTRVSNDHIEKPLYTMVVHGGAGVIERKNFTPEKEKAYTMALDSALEIGKAILEKKGTSMDAVIATIQYFEGNVLFNSGRGAVFNHNGKNELDASIMDGSNLKAGAVGGVQRIKSPIEAAKAVMEQSPHVLLVGAGAEEFAEEKGLEMVDPSYFYTKRRWEALQDILEKEKVSIFNSNPDYKYGTVGCVALDHLGNIVAGTSTGGMTNKRWNRIGDSPVIGAGTYANNKTCGVSATGHGEFFIRYAVANDISAQMMYGNKSLEEAAHHTIMKRLVEVEGSGGIVALDKYGNVSMTFNSPGMYRGYVKPNEKVIKIFE